jgi:hypothetical protein
MRKLFLAALFKACTAVGGIHPAPAASGMITDDQCYAQGGHIEDEHTYDYERGRDPGIKPTPYRVCRVPAKTNGKSCTSSSQCDGRCMCTGALARPTPQNDPALTKLDGTKGTGVCSDGHLPPGDWFCTVEGGKIQLAGIIID